jgi:pimeloyl-ACP methyl ester carboxylesterase
LPGRTIAAVDAEPRTFSLPSGTVAAELRGDPDAPLVILLPGLSANLRSFDVIAARLAGARRTLAYDPRGRGRSEKTPLGTYGWESHAGDVVAMADQLGAATFDLVGWSFGTWVAMTACGRVPGRVRRLVLIDGGGIPEDRALVPIYAGLERLPAVHPSRERFLELVRPIGIYEPWDRWLPYFEYELEDVEGGVRPRTWAAACWEDERHRKARDPYPLWDAVTMPALMIRATQPIPPDFGHILSADDLERFQRSVPCGETASVAAQHYSIGVLDETAELVRGFLVRS